MHKVKFWLCVFATKLFTCQASVPVYDLSDGDYFVSTLPVGAAVELNVASDVVQTNPGLAIATFQKLDAVGNIDPIRRVSYGLALYFNGQVKEAIAQTEQALAEKYNVKGAQNLSWMKFTEEFDLHAVALDPAPLQPWFDIRAHAEEKNDPQVNQIVDKFITLGSGVYDDPISAKACATQQRREDGPPPTILNKYLELLKRTIVNYPYNGFSDHVSAVDGVVPEFGNSYRANGLEGNVVVEHAHTTIPVASLDHLQHCIEEVVRNGVPGDLLEAGVFRGGASIFMRLMLDVLNNLDRKVWVVDSFEGIPPEDDDEHTRHWTQRYDCSLDMVKQAFHNYGALDERVVFVKGRFANSLPVTPIGSLAILRIDADAAPSIMDALNMLYPKLSPGGIVIFDDYHLPPVRKAIKEFREKHGITAPILPIPMDNHYGCTSRNYGLIRMRPYAAFWRK